MFYVKKCLKQNLVCCLGAADQIHFRQFLFLYFYATSIWRRQRLYGVCFLSGLSSFFVSHQ